MVNTATGKRSRRGDRKRGPYPQELGPKRIINVKLRVSLKIWRDLRSSGFTLDQVQDAFRKIVHDPLAKAAKDSARRLTPYRSGDLLNSLLTTIDEAEDTIKLMNGPGYEMQLATPDIDYAAIQNKYSTAILSRPKTSTTNVTAEYGWFDKTLKDSRVVARRLIQAYYREIARLLSPIQNMIRGTTLNVARRMFQVTIPTR